MRKTTSNAPCSPIYDMGQVNHVRTTKDKPAPTTANNKFQAKLLTMRNGETLEFTDEQYFSLWRTSCYVLNAGKIIFVHCTIVRKGVKVLCVSRLGIIPNDILLSRGEKLNNLVEHFAR